MEGSEVALGSGCWLVQPPGGGGAVARNREQQDRTLQSLLSTPLALAAQAGLDVGGVPAPWGPGKGSRRRK